MAIDIKQKLFLGLKNDEDEKQISSDFFTNMLNFGYADTGTLGINKILFPAQVAIFLSPDLELDTTDKITLTGDNILSTTHSGTYLWDNSETKWGEFQWS